MAAAELHGISGFQNAGHAKKSLRTRPGLAQAVPVRMAEIRARARELQRLYRIRRGAGRRLLPHGAFLHLGLAHGPYLHERIHRAADGRQAPLRQPLLARRSEDKQPQGRQEPH